MRISDSALKLKIENGLTSFFLADNGTLPEKKTVKKTKIKKCLRMKKRARESLKQKNTIVTQLKLEKKKN